ncbi:MAG: hypothetical protein AB8C84_06600 [Oligoflexales bacterium]
MKKYIFLCAFFCCSIAYSYEIVTSCFQGSEFVFHEEKFNGLEESVLYHELFVKPKIQVLGCISLEHLSVHLDSLAAIHNAIENKTRILPQPGFLDLPREVSLNIKSFIPNVFNKIFYDDLHLLNLHENLFLLRKWHVEKKHISQIFDVCKLFIFGVEFEFIQYQKGFSFLKKPISEKQYNAVVGCDVLENRKGFMKNINFSEINVFLKKLNKECDRQGFFSGFSLPSCQEWIQLASWNKFLNMSFSCTEKNVWIFECPEWTRTQMRKGCRAYMTPISQGEISENVSENDLNFRLIRTHPGFKKPKRN